MNDINVFKDRNSLVSLPCPGCDSNAERLIAVENGLRVVKCKNCGLIRVNPRPDEKALSLFYQNRTSPDTSSPASKALASVFLKDAREVIKRCENGRILDIGCGYGHFLQVMKDKGWVSVGVDIDKDAVRKVREELKIEAWESAVEDAPLSDNSFDAITMGLLLEHLPYPERTLIRCRQLLKPGGILYVRVPNINFLQLYRCLAPLKRFEPFLKRAGIDLGCGRKASMFNFMEPPLHLFGYSPKTLENLLLKSGFEQVSFHRNTVGKRGNIINRIIDFSAGLLDKAIYFGTFKKIIFSPVFAAIARKTVKQ